METSKGHIYSSSLPKKLLVVDDDKNLREVLAYQLQREGYRILTAAYGREAVLLAQSEQPALVVLDVMLPDISGFEVCRVLRRSLSTPIVMLSARSEEVDKLLGLELGADDYLTKPFSYRELLARIHAQLRRYEMLTPLAPSSSQREGQVHLKVAQANTTLDQALSLTEATSLLVAGDIRVELGQRVVTCAGRPVSLTPREFDLLAFLVLNPRQVHSRQELLQRVWGYEATSDTRTVDVHIRWLRAKLEADPAKPQLIQTIYSIGYRFSLPVVVVQGAI